METATDDMPPEPAVERCTCCGRTDVGLHVRLYCHPEIALCDRCLLWLNGRRVQEALGRLVFQVKSRRSRLSAV